MGERLASPIFTIVKEYGGRLPLSHMDVYRLEFSEEDLGFDEYFYGSGVAVVEWAQFIEEFLPEEYLAIKIERLGETERKLSFVAVGSRYEGLIKQLGNSSLGSFIV